MVEREAIVIIEGVFSWLINVLNNAISLLPDNGTLFDSVPKLTLSSLKLITVMNGYLPMKELGLVFVTMLAVQASLIAIEIVMGIYAQITKLIP
jgi:hypothetical protein